MSETSSKNISALQNDDFAPVLDPPEAHRDKAKGKAEEFPGRETRVCLLLSFLTRICKVEINNWPAVLSA